jgi:hypothetical protein
MIVGIVGRTEDEEGNLCSLGTGKDTVADLLVSNHEFVKVALADEMKRICATLYKFSYEQMWGPSQLRNAVDTRYPREWHVLNRDGKCSCCGAVYYEERGWSPTQCYLTPRYALQLLGTEWGKFCFRDTWARRVLEDIAPQLLVDVSFDRTYDKYRRVSYLPALGLVDRGEMSGEHGDRIKGLVISDVRFEDEVRYIKKHEGKILLVYRKVEALPEGPDLSHQSEVDLNKYSPDDPLWDDVIYNFEGVDALITQTQQALNVLRGKV